MEEDRKKASGRRQPMHGEVGVRYGARNFLRYPSQGLIAQDGHWHLVCVPAWSDGDWLSFKLYLNRKAKKNLWHIGVKNGQPSKSRERKLLEDHHPGRIDWVVAQAELYRQGKIRLKQEKGKAVIFVSGKGWQLKGKSNG